jgi:hypothetical protein
LLGDRFLGVLLSIGATTFADYKSLDSITVSEITPEGREKVFLSYSWILIRSALRFYPLNA